MTEEKVYYSKLLLFGEYSVICDSMGLTVPLSRFEARWQFRDNQKDDAGILIPDPELFRFYFFLQQLSDSKELIAELDLAQFEEDLKNGLYFDSTIPQGFGVGSSGALCAAVYERYQKNTIKKAISSDDGLQQLKEKLAQMESYFHGVSSGLDPLLCYLQKPLLIKSKSSISFVDLPEDLHFAGFSMFLIDTNVVGKTGPLVNQFFEKCRKHRFYKNFVGELIPANNQCIEALVARDTDALFKALFDLSSFFLAHFEAMIPVAFHELWKTGLDSGDYYLKLCGSGGGGFLLGFTRNLDAVAANFHDKGIKIIAL